MIDVKEVYFSYGKNKEILSNINFSINKGEIFGFLGPNGAGKSTTQKILTGIMNNYKGQINIAGYDLQKVTKDYYEKIGVMFEMPYLYSNLSAVENLKYFSSFYHDNAIRNSNELLDLVQLKYDYRRKPVKSYSKGMKQRTSMARTLLNNPQILFLDEPISGLDPSGAVLIKNIIKKEKEKGTTIFLTTHNMFVADELCDRVAFIVDGKIKIIDTPKNLKSTCEKNYVEVEYMNHGYKTQKTLEIDRLKQGIPFDYDKILSIHTKEYTLEDIFIEYTGRRLSGV